MDWRDVTSSVGYGETVSVDIPVSIPEDAVTGTVTLTFKVIPGDFIASLEKQNSFKVGEMPPEEEEVSPTPVEEEIETTEPPKVETPIPAPPTETPEPEQEQVKAPELLKKRAASAGRLWSFCWRCEQKEGDRNSI